MEIKELTSLEEMLPQFDLMHLMYKKMTPDQYKSFLEVMIPNNYSQVAVFENDKCIGVTGIWFGTKLWCGKFIEIDNFIVHPEHRSKGIGDMICKFVDEKAKVWRNNNAKTKNPNVDQNSETVEVEMTFFLFSSKL